MELTEMHVKAFSQVADVTFLIWVIYNFFRGMARGPLTEGFRLAGFIFGVVFAYFFKNAVTNWFINSLKWPPEVALSMAITIIFVGIYFGATYMGILLTWVFTKGEEKKSAMSMTDRMLGGLIAIVTGSVIGLVVVIAPLVVFEQTGFSPSKYSYCYRYTSSIWQKFFGKFAVPIQTSQTGSDVSGASQPGQQDQQTKPLSYTDLMRVYNVVSKNPAVAMQVIAKDPNAQKLMNHPKVKALVEDESLRRKIKEKGPMIVLDAEVMAKVNSVLKDPEIAKLFRSIDWGRIEREIEKTRFSHNPSGGMIVKPSSGNTADEKKTEKKGGGLFDFFK